MSDDLVILRRYMSPVDAQLDEELLKGEGIHAVAFGASFAPYAAETQGIILRVAESDVERAEELLQAVKVDDNPVDDGDASVLRCPRCELEYCFYGKPRDGFAGLVAKLTGIGGESWRCIKCRHAWQNESDGYITPSRFAKDDPRPTFLLRRGREGMGMFFGFCVAFALLEVNEPQGIYVFIQLFAGLAIGRIIGGRWRYGVCSDPQCRAALRGRDEACPSCEKTVAGVIHQSWEHYAAVADVRREFAKLRAAERD